MNQKIHAAYCTAIATDLLADGESTALILEGHDVLICRFKGVFYAFKNLCPHQAQPLTNARVRMGKVICPFHGAQFELSNGASVGTLTKSSLTTYAVQIQDEMVQVLLPGTELSLAGQT